MIAAAVQLFKQIILNLKDTDEIIEITTSQPTFFAELEIPVCKCKCRAHIHIRSVRFEDHGCPHPVCWVCSQLLDSSKHSPDVSEFTQIESNNDEKYYKRYHRTDWVINLSGL